jgi:hypothetical protein
MKKICNMKGLIFCALCLSSIGCAAQVHFGVLAGYNIVSLPQLGKGYDQWDQSSSVHSFHSGVTAEFRLGKSWFLAPALLYFGNGAHDVSGSVNPGGGGYTEDYTLKLYYLRLPVNLLYKIKLSRSVHIIPGAGLYVSRGLWGSAKGVSYTYTFLGSTQPYNNTPLTSPHQPISIPVKFISNGMDAPSAISIKPYDFGYTFQMGIEWKRLQLIPSINNGLVKAYEGSGYNLKNRAFTLSLAYQFGAIL